jgi:hypothetical protein
MKPRDNQIRLAMEGYNKLSRYGIVYLAAEERTGKTITALLIAEKCKNLNKVLILTKKNALSQVEEGVKKGWLPTIEKCEWLEKQYYATNYHQASKITEEYDLIILDESHNYISSSPKPSSIWKSVKKLTINKPIIYISATPHAQGYQQLYHQFSLSCWSPWRKYKNFYAWFRDFGILKTIFVASMPRKVYTKTQEQKVRDTVAHLFITKTRKELGFEQEPKDKLHYIKLNEDTKDMYNEIIKNRVFLGKNATEMTSHIRIPEYELVCDTPTKLRTSLHMIEGGVLKTENQYLTLKNQEKIDYIQSVWGDTEDLVIFYQYIAEEIKLKNHFKRAKILQGTSNAEGVDLSHIKHAVVYSQDFSTAKYTQRRARQAEKNRQDEIIVHFLVVENAISEQCYKTTARNKCNFVDSVFSKVEI